MEWVMETDRNIARAGPEKRISDRIRSFLRAQIIFNNRMTTIECIVKNISATGARIALSDTLAVPTEFDIYIPQQGRSHHARLVWRDKESIGIDFMDVQQAAAIAAGAMPLPDFGADARLRELELQNVELKERIRTLSKKLEDLGFDASNVI
jgi:hypothetical protein